MVKKTFLFSAIAATFAALTTSVLAEGDVLTLTEKNFDSEILDKEIALVEFYAPWCGHCKALAPEYEIAATSLKSTVPLAKVDCTENQDLCQKYGVRGYPTLKVFRKGETSDYKGARKADGIVSYMQKQAAPAISELNASNFADFKNSDRVVVVGYATDDASKAALKEVADKLRDDYLFGIVTDEALAKEHEAKVPSIVLYKQFDDGRNDFEGSFETEEIEEFVKTNSVPLMDGIDASNFQNYVDAGLPLAYVFVDTEEAQKKYVEIITPLAKKFKGKINFVHIDTNRYAAHAQNLGLKEQWPAFAIQHLDTGAKFPFDQSLDITAEALEPFLQDYVEGKIKPTLKSAEAPADNNGPVKVVVGNEFNDIVLDASKDVFLEVYAPWCGHCKKLAPVWEQLGEAVAKQDSSIVIAKLDGTENDIPPEAGIDIAGFPTLKFIKAGTNEIIDYDGDRSLENLVQFIEENSSKKTKINLNEDTESKEAVNDHDEL